MGVSRHGGGGGGTGGGFICKKINSQQHDLFCVVALLSLQSLCREKKCCMSSNHFLRPKKTRNLKLNRNY